MLSLVDPQVDSKATSFLRSTKLRAARGADFQSAIVAAGNYASKQGVPCYVYKGNSYMNEVFRVALKKSEALSPVNNTGGAVYQVEPDLTVTRYGVSREHSANGPGMRRNAASDDELFLHGWEDGMREFDHGYSATLAACARVLAAHGQSLDIMALADLYHDPIVSYADLKPPQLSLQLIGRGLNEWWERAGWLGSQPDRSYRSSYSYSYERAPDFSALSEQIADHAKQKKIRRGTKRYTELLADVRPRALKAAATLVRDLSEARAIRIDGEIAKVTKDAAAKAEHAAHIEHKAAVAYALIEAAGVGPSDAAILAMKELLESRERAAAELQKEAEYLESTKEGLDPEQVATEWWDRTYGA